MFVVIKVKLYYPLGAGCRAGGRGGDRAEHGGGGTHSNLPNPERL